MTVLFEKRDLPVVSVSISNRFGAAYESSTLKGIAHVIEHSVFMGTKTRSHEQISSEIEKRGGILNAFTSHEITSFWFKLPSEHLFTGLTILSDLLLHPLFNEKKFEKEKRVIIEEIKMYHDDPARSAQDLILENLYTKPFGQGIAGDARTVSSLTRDFTYDYFKGVYSPEHYIVTVVGNANFAKICAFLEDTFKLEKHKPLSFSVTKKNGTTIEKRKGIDQAHFVFAVHAPLPGERACYALELLDAYLASGMSSQLFLKIREEKGLAYTIQSALNAEKNYSFYSLYTGTTAKAIPLIQKIILEELSKLQHMTSLQLDESKERLIGLAHLSKEESTKVMMDLLFTEYATKAEDYYARERILSSITLSEVRALAKSLSLSSFSTVSIIPA